MLEIKDLNVKLEEEDKQILKGVNLTIGEGEVHAIMGPNGSGKSTTSYVLSGRDGYEVTGGTVTMDGEDLLEMEPKSGPPRASSSRSNIPLKSPVWAT